MMWLLTPEGDRAVLELANSVHLLAVAVFVGSALVLASALGSAMLRVIARWKGWDG